MSEFATSERVRDVVGRLARLLGPQDQSADFLAGFAGQESAPTAPPAADLDGPLGRLTRGLGLDQAGGHVLVLAGLAEDHEGLAEVLRGLHPQRLPCPTVGLVLALAEHGLLPVPSTAADMPRMPGAHGDLARDRARSLLMTGPLAMFVEPGRPRPAAPTPAPFPERSITLPEGLWPALRGEAGWPGRAVQLSPEVLSAVRPAPVADDASVAAALLACGRMIPITVLVDACGDQMGAAARLAVLLSGTGARPVVLAVPTLDERVAIAIGHCALARGVTPVLVPASLPDGPGSVEWCPLPMVLVPPTVVITETDAEATLAGPTATGRRPTVRVRVSRASAADRATLWRTLLPGCVDAHRVVPPATDLATCLAVARDAATSALIRGTEVTAADVRLALGDHVHATPPGVQRIRPFARWVDLVLPPDRLAQLHEAVARVRQSDTVLNRWGFLAGRPGRAGVRLLFHGPSGTGKTLAAEVIAGELDRDLLVVDLSRMVSKWIGETEKNLALAFDAGERGDAVLLFDEADALFGKRTEVGDARDRYANLETAYLLNRLAWFDGVAVLATNLRQNIDQAFARRLEFVIGFDVPESAERLALWRRHLPAAAPVATEVDLAELAEDHPVSGAVIRNAAVAAAYLAADRQGSIGPADLQAALRREYEKAGRAYPGSLRGDVLRPRVQHQSPPCEPLDPEPPDVRPVLQEASWP